MDILDAGFSGMQSRLGGSYIYGARAVNCRQVLVVVKGAAQVLRETVELEERTERRWVGGR